MVARAIAGLLVVAPILSSCSEPPGAVPVPRFEQPDPAVREEYAVFSEVLRARILAGEGDTIFIANRAHPLEESWCERCCGEDEWLRGSSGDALTLRNSFGAMAKVVLVKTGAGRKKPKEEQRRKGVYEFSRVRFNASRDCAVVWLVWAAGPLRTSSEGIVLKKRGNRWKVTLYEPGRMS